MVFTSTKPIGKRGRVPILYKLTQNIATLHPDYMSGFIIVGKNETLEFKFIVWKADEFQYQADLQGKNDWGNSCIMFIFYSIHNQF